MKKFWKKGLAYFLAFAMLPHSQVAYAAEAVSEAAKEKPDIHISWAPEKGKEEIKTGEEGTIVLKAELDTRRKAASEARVEITLTSQEAEAMKEYQEWDREEGDLFLLSGKGKNQVPIYLAEDGDEVRLSFMLDEENDSLKEELHFSLPADTAEIFDIDVDENDISVEWANRWDEEQQEYLEALEASEDEDDSDGRKAGSGVWRGDEDGTDSDGLGWTAIVASRSNAKKRSASNADYDEESSASDSNSQYEAVETVIEYPEPKIQIETGTLSIAAGSFDWEMNLDAPETEGEDLSFVLTAVSRNREEAGALYTDSQSFSFTVTLPEAFDLPEGRWTYDAKTSSIRAGGTTVAVFEGIPEDGEIVDITAEDAKTLTFVLERTRQEEAREAAEELPDLEITVTFLRSALLQSDVAYEELAEKYGEIPVEKEEPEKPGLLSRVRSLFSFGGAEEETGSGTPEWLDQTADTMVNVPVTLAVTMNALPGIGEGSGISLSAEAEAKAVVPSPLRGTVAITERDSITQDIFWADGANRDTRPDFDFKVASSSDAFGKTPIADVKFTLVKLDESGNETSISYGPYDISDYREVFQQEQEVQVRFKQDGANHYVMTLGDGDTLPTEVTYTDEYKDITTYRVKWTVEPNRDLDKDYDLLKVDKDQANESDLDEGWYYIQKDNLTFQLNLRTGETKFSEDKLKTILKDLKLSGWANAEDQSDWLEKMKNDLMVEENDDGTYTVKISGLWKYTPDGKEFTYSLKAENNQISLGSGEEDSLSAYYDNAQVPNHGTVTTALYDGGTLHLALTGTVDYKAEKVWLDDFEGKKAIENRPNVTFELWRYRASEGYRTAAVMRDKDGKKITIQISGDAKASDIYELKEGALSNLPKYDPEGYRYVYVLREIMDSSSGASQYEQVFGEVSVNEDGNETVKDTMAVWDEDQKEYVLTSENVEREPGNQFIYNTGTISNRITGTVTAKGTKEWRAAALQADFGNVVVEFTLQSKRKDDPTDPWEDVVNSSGEKTAEYLYGFSEVAMSMSISKTMPQYDAKGRELEYRWAETGVYQVSYKNGDGTVTEAELEAAVQAGFSEKENLLKTSAQGRKTFTLRQGGTHTYWVEENKPVESGNTYSTEIVNHPEDTVGYNLEKIWLDENGNRIDPENEEATFDLYRLQSGTALTSGMLPYITFTLDGEPDGDCLDSEKSSGTEISAKEDRPWHVEITGLPEFSEDGYEYEYLLLEENAFPHYQIEWNEETKSYNATVTNGYGSGSMILVRKEWIDDNDTIHREPVTVHVYAKPKNADEKTEAQLVGSATIGVGSNKGESGIWQEYVGLNLDKDTKLEDYDLYIREVGKTSAGAERESEIDAGSILVNENHRYEVTYNDPVDIGNMQCYTVQNRRLGNVDVTVQKTWVDGEGTKIREDLREAVDEANANRTDKELVLALRLKFADGDDGKDFEITYTGTNTTGDTVFVGGEESKKVPIHDDKGKDASSEQAVDLDGSKREYYFYNLPKYDAEGKVVHYAVEEVWLLQPTNDNSSEDVEVLNPEQLADKFPDVYKYWKEYQTSYGDQTYTVNSEVNDQHDTQEIPITNRLHQTKSVIWHKQWEDEYNFYEGLRPDIYLDIYRVVHERDDNDNDGVKTKVELVRENYRWVDTDIDPDKGETGETYRPNWHWHAQLTGLQKYDDLGYEILYYAVEKSSVNREDFDYTETAYRVPTDEEGDILPAGSEQKGGQVTGIDAKDGTSNDWLIDVSEEEGSAEGEKTYALAENGTFVNRIKSNVRIDGRKIWSNLPMDGDYPEGDLPEIKLSLTRYVMDGDDKIWDKNLDGSRKEIASLTLSDWKLLSQNGSYYYSIAYEGKNDAIRNSDGKVQFVGPNGIGEVENDSKLDKYDSLGRLYTYVLTETVITPNLTSSAGEGTDVSGSPDGTDGGDTSSGAANAIGNDWAEDMSDIWNKPDPVDGNYTLTNTYTSDQGASVAFDKYLYLPTDESGEVTAYPAVYFRLYRTYETNAGKPSECCGQAFL